MCGDHQNQEEGNAKETERGQPTKLLLMFLAGRKRLSGTKNSSAAHGSQLIDDTEENTS